MRAFPLNIFTKTPMAVANNYAIFEPLSFR